MNYIGAVRIVSSCSMLSLKKTKLSCFTKLNRLLATCFRLLFRCQLSNPLEDIGPLAYAR